jgi:predicted nucleic acid-binding protein
VLGAALAAPIGKKLRAKGTYLETLALCDVEFVSGLRSALARKELSIDRAAEALQDYQDLPLRLHPHRPFLKRIWELRNNFSAYDAAYVVLAEKLNAEFLTADDRLARSVSAHTSVRLMKVST